MINLLNYLLLSSLLISSVFANTLLGFKICCNTSSTPQKFLNPLHYLIGLLISLTLTFFLFHFGLNLQIAFICSFYLLPLTLILKNKPRLTLPKIKSLKDLDLNLILWIAVNIFLAQSIFYVTPAIITPWPNNYGDLAFHFGMISSFVHNANSAPYYHIFPFEKLSYPFLVNFWSALYWSFNSSFESLRLTFSFQWLVIWTLIYLFLNGRKTILLPWALLFGGGSYYKLLGYGKDQPFSFFLSDIWITQRSAMFGTACILAALYLVNSKTLKYNFILAGLVLALSSLVHTHSVLVTVLFINIYLVIKSVKSNQSEQTKGILEFINFNLGLLPAIIFLPWLLSKSGMIHYQFGWYFKHSNLTSIFSLPAYFISFFYEWTISWLKNLDHIACLFIFCLIYFKDRAQLLIILLLFVLANIIILAAWQWDQIKIFLALYVCFCFYLSSRYEELNNLSKKLLFQVLLLILCIPSLLNTISIIRKNHSITVYSIEDLKLAKEIRDLTPQNAIIAGNPIHNSPITLSGRYIYYGYEGTLWSHNISYTARKKTQFNFEQLISSKENLNPDYILIRDQDLSYWKLTAIPDQLKKIGDHLYQIQ